uniref:Uncharacterized protein n=1 Tax=Arion vulgaris TaxID=1028688 RepID=A0A0B7B1Z6_9EUPU
MMFSNSVLQLFSNSLSLYSVFQLSAIACSRLLRLCQFSCAVSKLVKDIGDCDCRVNINKLTYDPQYIGTDVYVSRICIMGYHSSLVKADCDTKIFTGCCKSGNTGMNLDFSVCVTKAASSANSISQITTFLILLSVFNHARLKKFSCLIVCGGR